MNVLRRHWDISLILLLFVVLSLAYSVVNPLHEATDELRHYRFVRYIVTHGQLPVQGAEACRFQSHHPPLFYALGAAATFWIETGRDLCYTPPENPFWAYRYADVGVDNKNQYLHGSQEAFPWQGEALAAHIIRALNVLIGAGTVWLTWATGRAVWPRRRALATGGVAFVAFNPMFLYMAGAINNDVAAAFSGAALLLATVYLLRDPRGLSRRRGLLLGALYGLALMSKFNMAALALLVAAAATYVAWQRGQWRRWLEMGLISAGVAGLISGWWFVRNQFLYGEPTGFRTVTELWGARDPLQSLPLALSELPHAWSTLWGRFGYGQIPLPDVVYDGLAWIVFAGLLGFVVALIRRRHKTPASVLLLLALDVVLLFAVLFNYMLVSPAGAMGRFFFPGLPALGLLTFYGLSHVADGVRQLARRLHRGREIGAADDGLPSGAPGLALLANAGMLALALAALFAYLAPAYARPPTLAAGAPIPNEVNANFSGLATLRGYRLSAGPLRPGQPLDVQLYWEVTGRPPGNFLLFLHLIDESGTIVAQRDTHPGTGNLPTSQWQPGDRFVDSLRVYVPETAYTPAEVTVSVGLYAPTYRLAIAGPQGVPWGDALTLGSLQLLPARELAPDDRDLPNPLDKNFQNEVRLRGYSYGQRILAPGEELPVTLYWQRLGDPRLDYVLRLELLDEAGHLRAGIDSPLPLEAWTSPGIAAETYRLALPEDLAPDSYRVRLILLDPETGQAHHIVAPDGHYVAEHLDLARIRLRATEAN